MCQREPYSLSIGCVNLADYEVVGGFFTRTYVEHPLRFAALAITYVVVAVRLWQSAARKSQR